MTDTSHYEAKILDSWCKNAQPWTHSIRNELIESRKLVTNKAIIQAVVEQRPGRVLDVGCGEGWLVRDLIEQGLQASGVDVVDELIEQARRSGVGQYHSMSYQQLEAGDYHDQVDVMVCNFSLLGKQSTESVFRAAQSLLQKSGSLIVQTLHPNIACGDLPYEDGWREGSWAGFAGDFVDPAPWYFRTLESWTKLFTEHGMLLREIREPLHPQTFKPASIIFIGEAL